MSTSLLLSPPVLFLLILLIISALVYIFSKYSFRKEVESEDAKKAYACGEEFTGHLIQPDYSQFFPFAFFFTILHVVALVIATVPIEKAGTFAIAIVYIIGAVMGLYILLRK